MNEEKNETLQEEKKEDVIDKALDLSPENIEKVKEQIANEIIDEHKLTEEQGVLFKQLCEEAEQPVQFLDKDFKLGPQELDIRKLSKKNLEQMFFRTQVQQITWLKNVHNTMLDVIRLLFVLLDHLGVENIAEATDAIESKLAEQTEVLKEFKKQNKSN